MDYKSTLILPDTTFPMRGNLPQNEPSTYAKWQSERLYYHLREVNTESSSKPFVLHDGPPYANGHLHIGHALNKILKDIIVKFHYFKGCHIAYTPGWDCHGLPIEQQVEQKLGKEKKDALPKTKLRQLCREHAQKFIEIQKNEFQSLGVLGDFENPYKTMDFAFEAQIYRTLIAVAKEGLLAERSKPIYWSWACETALADAEVEYQEKQSDSIFVAFSLKEGAINALKNTLNTNIQSIKLIIWTTTPWTLPANVAIALSPSEKYVLTQKGYIVAKALHERLENKLGLGEIVGEFASTILERECAINPLNGRDSVIILGEHVSMGDGSGAVHTAPGHGEDDYKVALKYELPVIMPVDDRGDFSPLVESMSLVPREYISEFVGKHIFDTHEKIFEILGEHLLHKEVITHSYPHCWRSHKPVIFRATKQWFILMDKPFFNGKTLRELALSELEGVKFYPSNGKNRIVSMIENRPDWCISRQRDWGVPIAFFIDKGTNEALLDSEILEHLADIFEKEGCDAWWDKDIEELLPTSHKHLAPNLHKSKHILDVWFDSGSTWNAVLNSKNAKNPCGYEAGDFPADMYLEGSDQHRGWFQSSLLLSCIVAKHAPYKNIITHGFTFDRNGEKMSKSKGNVIAPSEIIKTQGSEILRLWVALSNYQSDQNISDEILKQVGEQYRKIRNTIRFLLANTQGLENMADSKDLSSIDRWILNISDRVFNQAHASMNEYEFARAYQIVMNFLTNELSGIYLDLCKDSLYCDKLSSKKRQAIQSTLVVIAYDLLHFIAPVLTYTANEAYTHAPKILYSLNPCQKLGVFGLRHKMHIYADSLKEEGIDFERLMRIREKFGEALDALKKQKSVKSSLEVVLLSPRDDEFKSLDEWLIISGAISESSLDSKNLDSEILGEFSIEGEIFKILHANATTSGEKCERCWKYSAKNGQELCERCQSVMA